MTKDKVPDPSRTDFIRRGFFEDGGDDGNRVGTPLFVEGGAGGRRCK